jgi:hypothetical protein
LKKTSQKRGGGVAQSVGSEFKPQCCKKEETEEEYHPENEKYLSLIYLIRDQYSRCIIISYTSVMNDI